MARLQVEVSNELFSLLQGMVAKDRSNRDSQYAVLDLDPKIQYQIKLLAGNGRIAEANALWAQHKPQKAPLPTMSRLVTELLTEALNARDAAQQTVSEPAKPGAKPKKHDHTKE